MKGGKVAIIGAGAVGASAAYTLALTGACHTVLLYDIIPEAAIGKALDIAQSTIYSPKGTVVEAVIKPEDIKDCDVVVITAGVPRKKDMTRADLLGINAGIVKEVSENIKRYSPNAIIVSVSNPLDAMTYVAYRVTGWDRSRIIGMGGALDASRMAYQIGQKIGYGVSQVKPMVIGEHGEHMIPYPQIADVGGIPLSQIISSSDMDDIVKLTKDGGAEIVKYLKTSASFAPGRAISVVVEAILADEQKIIPSSVILDGEYGYSGVSIGVPAIIGANGVEKIVELEMDDATKKAFDESVKSVKDSIEILESSGFFKG